jgi:hypothetical protein
VSCILDGDASAVDAPRYVNHSLDSTTLRIANNDWKTWAVLLAVIEASAHLDGSGLFMGVNADAFELFVGFGAALVALNGFLLLVTTRVAAGVIAKLGGSADVEADFETVKAKWPAAEEWQDVSKVLREREKALLDAKTNKKKGRQLAVKSLKSAAKVVKSAARLSAVGRRIRNLGSRVKGDDALRSLGIDTKELARFQKVFMMCLRVCNMLQAFYISLIIAHWGWYARSHWEALCLLLPLLLIYLGFTPGTVRAYAMVMSLGKVDTRAMSETIEYMEHNDSALHDVAQLLVIRLGDSGETIADVFNEWDTSGDGELSFKEMQAAMVECNMHMPASRFSAMWRKIDIDSSGGITADEFSRALLPCVLLVPSENLLIIDLYAPALYCAVDVFCPWTHLYILILSMDPIMQLRGDGDQGERRHCQHA